MDRFSIQKHLKPFLLPNEIFFEEPSFYLVRVFPQAARFEALGILGMLLERIA
jgi:hypothetical protein